MTQEININNDMEPEEEDTRICEWCAEENPESDTVQHPNIRSGLLRGTFWLCRRCDHDAFSCVSCGSVEHYEDSVCVGSEYWCSYCRDEYLGYCDMCGEYWNYGSHDECPDCTPSSRLIHDYSFRPEPVFFISRGLTAIRSSRSMTFTGFELEMEAVETNVDDGAQFATEKFGEWCYLKYDGSLSNGFEMVSHPLSYRYFLESFPFADLSELAKLGMRSANTGTCGLHIHINKSFFQSHPSTMYRFMSLFYRNAESWKPIAGRKNSSYASWSEYELDRMLYYAKGLKDGVRNCNNERYVALNLQNSNTIELRFFRGTLKPEVFAGRIEAAHAAAHYAFATRNSVSIKEAHNWERFREWTIANNYNMFNALAESKGV